MTLVVRPMQLEETSLVIDYFHGASAEHLKLLGVDPTALPLPGKWRQIYEHDFVQPLEQLHRIRHLKKPVTVTSRLT